MWNWLRKPSSPERWIPTNEADPGPFITVFMSSGYVDLMYMGSSNVTQVLTSIDAILRSTAAAPRHIERMLLNRNYRDHLVAAAAILLSHEPAAYASHMWATFDRGSWVAPQLAVSLYYSDGNFAEEARRRIVARCPIDDSDNFFRGHTSVPSAKNLASLLQVLNSVPAKASWVASERQAKDVQTLLEADIDSAGTIVEWWSDRARKAFVAHFQKTA